MTDDPFNRDHAPTPGEVETLAPGIRVVTAPNPGPMTFTGTRSFIVGQGEVALIDPGPNDPAHLTALQNATEGERVTAILITHAHIDHSAAAREAARIFDAPVMAHGDPVAARSPLMSDLAERFDLGGGEGIDATFTPDRTLRDGDTIDGPGWSLRAIHTPGHLADHLSFALGDTIFSGDVAMGWAPALISPPDGDLASWRNSIRTLLALKPTTLHPGHGAPVDSPALILDHLLSHRQSREAQVLDALSSGPTTIPAMVTRIYADVDPRLHPAAARNVFAHLIDLVERGEVTCLGQLGPDAQFSLIG